MNSSALISEYINLGRLIRAEETFSPVYEKDTESLRQLLKLEAKMERDLIRYFNGLVRERIDTFINWNEYRRRVIIASIVDPMSDDKWKSEAKLFKQALYDAVYLGTLNGVAAGVNIYSAPLLADDIIAIAQISAKKHVGKLVTQTNRNTRKMINRSVRTSLDLGETVQQASKRVNKIVKNPTRSTTIARTETVNSYGKGLLDFGQEAGATHKEWQSVLDGRTSPVCEELDGQVVKIDAEFESSYEGGIESPGAHVNCVLPGTEVAASDVELGMKRRYSGDIFVITTALGNKLSVTPNHPILTSRGWVVAQSISVGDEVISTLDAKAVASGINPDNHQVPAPVQEVFRTLLEGGKVSPITMPTTTKDFHGDITHGDVDIVRADSFLGGIRDSEHIDKLKLISANFNLPSFYSLRSLNLLLQSHFATSYSSVGSSDILGMLSGGSLVGHETISDSIVSESDPLLAQDPSNNTLVDSEFSGKLIDRYPSIIKRDTVRKVTKRVWSGHVYNLQTKLGWYIADNIVTHNCRSGMVLIFEN